MPKGRCLTASKADLRWLAAAAALAERGRPASAPNPSVGAIIVKEGRVIGRGWTQAGGRPHAEAVALAQAGSDAAGATLYVTLEPCAHDSARGPACSALVAAAGLARVVIGAGDPDPRTAGGGIARLEAAGIETVLADFPRCADSLAGYLTRAAFGRPHVTLKLALSIDGSIALADGTSQWITGEEARAHVHAHRAKNDAILVGGGTWRADRPRLDVRLPGLEDRSPRRILLSRGVKPDNVDQVINRPEQIAELSGVQYLYVEGGAGAAASLLARDTVDELHLYRAPILIGDGLRGVAGLDLADLASAHGRWRATERRQLGSDEFTAYSRVREKEPA